MGWAVRWGQKSQAVQQMEVQLAVGVDEEYPLAVVATLGDVVRGSWQNAACVCGHVMEIVGKRG